MLLSQEIKYYGESSKTMPLAFPGLGKDLNTIWGAGDESVREKIVGGMTTAKDEDYFNPNGATTEFGISGVESYRDIKNKKLLNP